MKVHNEKQRVSLEGKQSSVGIFPQNAVCMCEGVVIGETKQKKNESHNPNSNKKRTKQLTINPTYQTENKCRFISLIVDSYYIHKYFHGHKIIQL